MLFELTREVAGVLVPETEGGFADVAAVAQEFDGPLHSQPLEPAAGRVAECGQEEPFQSADGNTAGFRQGRHGVAGLVGKLRPVANEG